MSAPVAIRSASTDEKDATLSTVAQAFVTDPVMRYLLERPHEFMQFAPLIIRAMGGASFEHGTAFVDPGFAGAALWLPPGVHGDEEEIGVVMAQLAEACPEAMPRLENMGAVLEQMGASHPQAPHWYLPFIGVEPNAQGRGVGAALMKHAVTRWDDEGSIAYLESSNPRNISLYERFGFEAIREIRIGDVPVVTPMVRHPA